MTEGLTDGLYEQEIQAGKKALIAMSGGVDSSVAASLMQQAGCHCVGVTMRLFDPEADHTCCTEDDVADARAVAAALEMPYEVVNFSGGFRTYVLDRFVAAYEAGRTPNPCIDCNRYLKFSALFELAEELDCDYLVTGHYARTAYDAASGRHLLLRGLDEDKDQSYVLYTLSQIQLAKIRFPLGGLTKEAARALAASSNLATARKHDSQDLCFVKDGKYGDFIEGYTGRTYPAGDFVDEAGQVLGRHRGIIRYTIGQRRGLGLALKAPMYVKAIDTAANQVILSREEALYTDKVLVEEVNWIAEEKLTAPRHAMVKLRYTQRPCGALIEPLEEDRVRLHLDEPARAVTGGQAAVFYDGEIVLGGGTIA